MTHEEVLSIIRATMSIEMEESNASYYDNSKRIEVKLLLDGDVISYAHFYTEGS